MTTTIHHYRGESYQVPSGQWAWVIYRDGEDYCRGAGYEDEADAEEALCDQLAELDQGFTETSETEQDDLIGMDWWNLSSDAARRAWMRYVGGTGRVVDAWEAFKASGDTYQTWRDWYDVITEEYDRQPGFTSLVGGIPEPLATKLAEVKIEFHLDDTRALALAQLVKRIGWAEMRQNAVDDAECYHMRDAIDVLGRALAEAGYAPR